MFDEMLSGVNMANYVDFRLVLLLLCTGLLIKHFIEKLPNKIIPYILMIISIAYEFATIDTFTKSSIGNSLIDAIICAAIAIGLHTSGKGLFKAANIGTIFKSIFNNSVENEEDTESDEITEEDIDEDNEE
ncbi:phage holin family protein [uncultured Clostridium sp.]|uniref:phage holin family protein n=1 Tax=uncultured Clostridium sp. TaxID=59620 RepID=UPI00263AC783|nr:phage holin family protein [uncultured Clostridium sp.]